MKKFVFLFLVTGLLIACKTEDKKSGSNGLTQSEKEKAVNDSSNYTTIDWVDSTALDLGQVKKGKMVEVSFRFRNSGNKPLVIADVAAGCGCTVPEKPQEPYSPGNEGVIKAKFDSQNQAVGEHTKYVTVTANTTPNNTHQLSFRVEIIE